MSQSSSAQFNQHLTNYARGLSQDLPKALADFVAPQVPTGVANGQYKKYDDKNAFQVYRTRRAMGGKARRIEFDATDPFFNCSPNALEIGIDDHEREKAGENIAQLEEAKIKTLVSSATISHEDEVFAAIFAALAAVGGLGVWSDVAVDPVAQIDSQILAIATVCGMMPNRIALGLGAWAVIKNHPLVTKRVNGVESAVTLSAFAGMSLNPAMEIRMGVLSKDLAKFGAAANKSMIVGGEVLIFIGDDNANIYDPSFAKTFRTVRGGVDRVEGYRDEPANSDIKRVQWTDQVLVTGSACGRRITLS